MKRRTILRGATLLPFLSEFPNETSESVVNQELSNKKIIKPKRLKVGDTLGVIAPSSALSEERVTRAVNNLTNLGFKIKLGKNVRAQNGYLAGTDAERLEDLHWAFSDPEVDAVWCIRGGYGATRLLPNKDFWIFFNQFKINIWQQSRRPITTANAPNGIDFRVAKSPM